MPALSPRACFSACPNEMAGFDHQVNDSVLGEQRQHVVKKPDAGRHISPPRAIQIERQPHAGFGCLAVDGGCS
jgi:hypothetical protein